MKDSSAVDLGIEKKWFGEVAENCWDILCSKLCGKEMWTFYAAKARNFVRCEGSKAFWRHVLVKLCDRVGVGGRNLSGLLQIVKKGCTVSCGKWFWAMLLTKGGGTPGTLVTSYLARFFCGHALK